MNLRTKKQEEGLHTLICALFQKRTLVDQIQTLARLAVHQEARIQKLERQLRTALHQTKVPRARKAGVH